MDSEDNALKYVVPEFIAYMLTHRHPRAKYVRQGYPSRRFHIMQIIEYGATITYLSRLFCVKCFLIQCGFFH